MCYIFGEAGERCVTRDSNRPRCPGLGSSLPKPRRSVGCSDGEGRARSQRWEFLAQVSPSDPLRRSFIHNTIPLCVSRVELSRARFGANWSLLARLLLGIANDAQAFHMAGLAMVSSLSVLGMLISFEEFLA